MNIISRIANQSAIDFYQIDGDRLLAGPTGSLTPRRTTKNGRSCATETLFRGFYSTTKLPGGKSSTGSIPAVAKTQADVVVNPPRSPAKRSLNEPTIHFDEYRINLRAEMFKFCLVGKFPAAVAGPSLEQVKEMASGEWNLQSNCSITLLDQSHLFIRLESEADMIRVWPRNEWLVDGQVMKVFKWTPMFRPTDGELPSAAVWVSLPSLPVVFYQEDLLYQIVSLVGKVLGVDDGTRNLTRTDSARVCVEVDLLKELPSRVWIEIGTKGFWQAIQYEGLPCFCTNCSTVGHKTISCKKNMEKVAIDASGEGTSRFETKNCDARVGYCHSCPLNGEIERLHSLKGSAAILDEERNIVAGIKIGLGSNQDVVGCSSGQVLESVDGKTVMEVSQENKRRRTKPVVIKEELPEIEEVGEMHSSKEQDEKEMASRELASRAQNLDKDHHNAGSSQGKHPIRGSHTASKQNFWKRHKSPERPSAPGFSIRRFSYKEMKVATKCFKEIIGEGGFGRVYKGKLGKDLVAIKRWNSDAFQGLKEFETEVMAFGRLGYCWHLVSLVGYCNENDELLLAYEYMSHGDLGKHLFDGSNTSPLTWSQRLKICIGAARALHHLHLNKIIHRDVKPRNILVDHNWEAKLTDLGISKVAILHYDSVTHLSTRIMGTYGYAEPHYIATGQLTYESDVYSFGVVMLEVLFGRPVIDAGKVNLETWRKSCRRKKIVRADIDAHLKGSVSPESLKEYSALALKCLADNRSDRAGMSEVIDKLQFLLNCCIHEGQRN